MARHFQRKGKRILGIDRQDAIRFFFGGNAMMSIVVLVLICLFLAREAVMFFPQHHKELQVYRKTGQEYVGYVIKEMDEYSKLVSLSNQAFYQEKDAVFAAERGLTNGYGIMAGRLEDGGENLIDALYEARQNVTDAESPAKKTETATGLKKAQRDWSAFVDKSLSGMTRAEIDQFGRLREADWLALKKGFSTWDPVEADPFPLVAEAEKRVAAGMAGFEKARAGIAGAGDRLKKLRGKLRGMASAIKKDAVANQTAAARKKALLQGAQNADSEEARQRMRKQAAEIVILDHFPYKKRTRPIVASKDEHRAAVAEMKKKLAPAVAALPAELKSPNSGELIAQVRRKYPNFVKHLDESVQNADAWRYDNPVGYLSSAAKFFFGRQWVTNSSWNDFYGLLPLFSGSLLISTVALVVAVPFSIGAAIYVNRLATRGEQHFIKPAIEMIQAIPSVVLGFFGIMVLGEGLRELSQTPWLEWVPGFPMQERLNILNAGLLLALMAVPTIFTLTEDALNNVPRSFSEASLALGASKLQTILKVIVPSALSGILAAVLLGFGRVIGETMVVLLVAGNQIAIPDFSAGLGVLTQPAHTMTGIIAQEMGEVSQGTLHWRALFLVGLVLFTISLLINVTAQRVIRRFGHRD